MKNKERTYEIKEETLDKVKAELMKEFDKYALMGLKATNDEEVISSVTGFQSVAIGASIFLKLAPEDYPVEELIISVMTAHSFGDMSK